MIALVKHGSANDICAYVEGLCKEMNFYPTKKDYEKVVHDCLDTCECMQCKNS